MYLFLIPFIQWFGYSMALHKEWHKKMDFKYELLITSLNNSKSYIYGTSDSKMRAITRPPDNVFALKQTFTFIFVILPKAWKVLTDF